MKSSISEWPRWLENLYKVGLLVAFCVLDKFDLSSNRAYSLIR